MKRIHIASLLLIAVLMLTSCWRNVMEARREYFLDSFLTDPALLRTVPFLGDVTMEAVAVYTSQAVRLRVVNNSQFTINFSTTMWPVAYAFDSNIEVDYFDGSEWLHLLHDTRIRQYEIFRRNMAWILPVMHWWNWLGPGEYGYFIHYLRYYPVDVLDFTGHLRIRKPVGVLGSEDATYAMRSYLQEQGKWLSFQHRPIHHLVAEFFLVQPDSQCIISEGLPFLAPFVPYVVEEGIPVLTPVHAISFDVCYVGVVYPYFARSGGLWRFASFRIHNSTPYTFIFYRHVDADTRVHDISIEIDRFDGTHWRNLPLVYHDARRQLRERGWEPVTHSNRIEPGVTMHHIGLLLYGFNITEPGLHRARLLVWLLCRGEPESLNKRRRQWMDGEWPEFCYEKPYELVVEFVIK